MKYDETGKDARINGIKSMLRDYGDRKYEAALTE